MEYFEITHRDAMGRIAKLETPHGVIETPTLMPVINPNIEFISASEMKKFGADMVITNSYIIYRTPSLRDVALEKGVHGLLDTDLAVMTDSGSYQLMVYGGVEVNNREIVEFQKAIGSDIAVPLDIPTPPDSVLSLAEEDLSTTVERESEAAELFKGEKALLAIPIQGSTHPELRRKSASIAVRIAEETGIRAVFPIGAVVPLLDTYRFADVARIVLEAKSVLPAWAPVHLFGAGHPMLFALAVALGCDLFDSAAYALYAKDDRYLTPYGTKKLNELHYFPCSCPVCSKYTPEELRGMKKSERARLIAEHNLYVCFEEIRTIKQAIKENTLFELVEKRIRSHPYLIAAWRLLKEERYAKLMEMLDAGMKQTFFYTGIESVYRPAVVRHAERVKQVELEGREFIISTNLLEQADFYLRPAFGIVPAELIESYPAGHAELPPAEYIEGEALEVAVRHLVDFLSHHSDKKFRIMVEDVWRPYIKDLPQNATLEPME
ncbi:tRNA guanosine(15) transglycosylase TgtA [Archaeoglobus veneficus]|uniref:tRNA-guanine(15) transglycosylase n=1 Tax=Archaeoglobus veneficus (strain DSM 11195 / SNP6) TaxID=693661 RepID=F2KRL1_ARCVS|nr:tRNA guanosine(15) transglycosylase TgtA [Archaeoglobus veneficus]AEA46776.1 7-cyano-7-deazaguanine tRNA-ribosyltransferase [Archaeoglobus veneficus SNP6]